MVVVSMESKIVDNSMSLFMSYVTDASIDPICAMSSWDGAGMLLLELLSLSLSLSLVLLPDDGGSGICGGLDGIFVGGRVALKVGLPLAGGLGLGVGLPLGGGVNTGPGVTMKSTSVSVSKPCVGFCVVGSIVVGLLVVGFVVGLLVTGLLVMTGFLLGAIVDSFVGRGVGRGDGGFVGLGVVGARVGGGVAGLHPVNAMHAMPSEQSVSDPVIQGM